MNDNRASDWTDGGGVEFEGVVEVVPIRHVWGKGGLEEEVQGDFGFWEELVPEEVGQGIGGDGEDGKHVSFKTLDGAFGYIAAMDIWQDKLESAVLFVNDGATILGASLIVEDLEINAVALGFEARHDYVVDINTMPVVA